MAVKKDIGLNRPEIHRDFGVIKSVDQVWSYWILWSKSWYQSIKFFLEK